MKAIRKPSQNRRKGGVLLYVDHWFCNPDNCDPQVGSKGHYICIADGTGNCGSNPNPGCVECGA